MCAAAGEAPGGCAPDRASGDGTTSGGPAELAVRPRERPTRIEALLGCGVPLALLFDLTAEPGEQAAIDLTRL